MIEEVQKCIIQLKILEQKIQNLMNDYDQLRNNTERSTTESTGSDKVQ